MTGPYSLFDNFNNPEEQDLHDSLIQDFMGIYGENMYYLPRRNGNLDYIYLEDDQDYFDTARPSTFYIKNVEGFEGQGNFMSKFGLEIRDQITLSVSNTIFLEDIGAFENMQRPREGDLIYYPQNNKVFEIVFVEKFSMFFPFGQTPTYVITCQLFEYTNQAFMTGIPAIDSIQVNLSENLYDSALDTEDDMAFLMEDGFTWLVEDYSETAIDPLDEDQVIQTAANAVLDFSESDPFSEGPF